MERCNGEIIPQSLGKGVLKEQPGIRRHFQTGKMLCFFRGPEMKKRESRKDTSGIRESRLLVGLRRRPRVSAGSPTWAHVLPLFCHSAPGGVWFGRSPSLTRHSAS